MRRDIDPVLDEAKNVVTDWFQENGKLCAFEADVYDGLYYTTPHGQAWYLLKFYPAYYAEYYLMYQKLQNIGVAAPKIVSLGCGALVDAAAARRVYGQCVGYTGYDKNVWGIKAANSGAQIINIAGVERYDRNTNVICLPRSIGDLVECFEAIGRAIAASNFEEQSLYVCSSLRVSGEHNSIAGDEGLLDSFIQNIQGYSVVSQHQYYPASDPERVGDTINQEIPGWWHKDPNFAKNLLRRCKEQNSCAKACESSIKPMAALKLKNLAFKILKLEKNAR